MGENRVQKAIDEADQAKYKADVRRLVEKMAADGLIKGEEYTDIDKIMEAAEEMLTYTRQAFDSLDYDKLSNPKDGLRIGVLDKMIADALYNVVQIASRGLCSKKEFGERVAYNGLICLAAELHNARYGMPTTQKPNDPSEPGE